MRISLHLAAAALLGFVLACSRDRPSGLDPGADSLAASVPLVPDTVRSSAMDARRLSMRVDTVVHATTDSTAPNWLRSSFRMLVTDNFFALYSAGNLKVFNLSGEHLWSTSRYDFSPGQAQQAKRSGVHPGAWLEWVVDGDSFTPGALLSASSIQMSGDSIVVLQASNSAVNIYNRTGRVIGLARLQRRDQGASFTNATALAPTPAGWTTLTNVISDVTDASTKTVTTYVLSRLSLVNGASGPPLRKLEWENQFTRLRRNNQVYTARPRIPLSPVTALANGSLYFSRGTEFAIEQYDEYGRLKRVVEVETERVPVTGQLLKQYSDNLAASYRQRVAEGDSSANVWLTEVLPAVEKIPSPKLRPVVGGIWVGADGSIAVRRVDLDPRPFVAGDSLIFDIVGSDGRYRGRVAFEQPDLSVLHFTGSAFYVAQVAGTLTRDTLRAGGDFARGVRGPPGRSSGAPTRPGFVQPPIAYQRLLRFTLQ